MSLVAFYRTVSTFDLLSDECNATCYVALFEHLRRIVHLVPRHRRHRHMGQLTFPCNMGYLSQMLRISSHISVDRYTLEDHGGKR